MSTSTTDSATSSATSSATGSTQINDASEKLNLMQPMSVLTVLAYFSPVILAACVTSMSFLFQNFKGLVYLAFLLGASLVRGMVYLYTGAGEGNEGPADCNVIRYTKYGNTTYSTFVFAFTFMYLIVPMMATGNMNFWIFSTILIFFAIDSFIKYYKQCVPQAGEAVLNFLGGLGSSAMIVSMMYAGGSGQFLFFNEVAQSNKEVCYQPKNQTFKCAVYKNGELLGPV